MLKFYENYKNNDWEDYIDSCAVNTPYIIPAIGDIIQLPVGDEDGELYKIKRRVIFKECVEYFCKLYDRED